MSNIGSCLCHKVKFSVPCEIKTVYHCHCSLCRKQTGTGANAATLVKENQFNWLMGKEYVTTYKKKLVLLHHFVIDVARLSLIKLMVQTICGYHWGFLNNRLNQI